MRAPRQHRSRGVLSTGSGEGGGLPAEGGELPGAGDRDDTGGLATLAGEDLPALVQPALGAPSDRDHARVLAVLAGGELVADRGLVVVVVGGLDEQAASVDRSGLGDRALTAFAIGGVLARDDAEEPRQLLGPKASPVAGDCPFFCV